MAISYRKFVVLIFVELFITDTCGLEIAGDGTSLTAKVLNALKRVLLFYKHEHQRINLDGIYGLRVTEGSLQRILQDQNSGKIHVSPRSHLDAIRQLNETAAGISNSAIPFLQENNPAYFEEFKKQVSSPWQEFKPFKKLDKSLSVPGNKRDDIGFDEDTSDRCMTDITGTGKNSQEPCKLSAQCWHLMTAKGAYGYALTHQALFLLLGETQGCTEKMNARLKQLNNGITLQKVYDQICASMYPQMLELENAVHRGGDTDRDLYMEQAMVCGMMGYNEFLSKERLENILGWQKRDGCFGRVEPEGRALYDVSYGQEKRDKRYVVSQHAAGHAAGTRNLLSMRTMRSLLVEKELSDGCMSHMTGVAAALLGVYIRWLVHEGGIPHGTENMAERTDNALETKDRIGTKLPQDATETRLAQDTIDTKSPHHGIDEPRPRRRIMEAAKYPVEAVGSMDHAHIRPGSRVPATSVFIVGLCLAGVGIVILARMARKVFLRYYILYKKPTHVI